MVLAGSPEISVVELSKLHPEKYPLIEPLQPNRTLQFLIDIDGTILDKTYMETPERVAIKVALLNQSLLELAISTDKQVLVTLVTKKPAAVFSHPDTKSLYSPLLGIKSVRKGLMNGEKCWVTMALPHSGAELGTITRIQSRVNPDSPELIVDPHFIQSREKIVELETILNDHLIFKESKQKYQLEPGNFIYLAVQLLGGRPMPLIEKKEVAQKIREILVELDRTDLLDLFDFSTDENDVDFSLPNIKIGKLISVKADIKSKKYQGYGWYSEKNQVVCDDSWKDTGEAISRVLKKGGFAISFANGNPQLTALIKQHDKGFVSSRRSFVGLLDGLHWLATGHKLTFEEATNIENRLKTAEIIRAFKDTVEVGLKSTGLFAIINFLSPPIPTSNIEINKDIINYLVPFFDFFFKGWFKWYPKTETVKNRNLGTEFVKSAMIAINPILTSIILNSGWQPEIQVTAMAGLLISNTMAYYLLRRREQVIAEAEK